VRLRIDDVSMLQGGLFKRIEVDSDLFRHRFGDLVLQRQRVSQIAVVALRPQVHIVARVD